MSVGLKANIKINGNSAVAAIGHAVAKHLNEAANKALPQIKARSIDAFEHSLKREPTYNQLIYSNLRGELGLARPEERAEAIIAILKTQVQINIRTFKWGATGLTGAIEYHVAQRSYDQILSSPAAEYISYNVDGGHLIPWLSWLIKGGTEELVKGWHIVYTTKAKSRSGLAIMEDGGNWSMPTRYAGTEDFNWITKSLDTVFGPVQEIITEELVRYV